MDDRKQNGRPTRSHSIPRICLACSICQGASSSNLSQIISFDEAVCKDMTPCGYRSNGRVSTTNYTISRRGGEGAINGNPEFMLMRIRIRIRTRT